MIIVYDYTRKELNSSTKGIKRNKSGIVYILEQVFFKVWEYNKKVREIAKKKKKVFKGAKGYLKKTLIFFNNVIYKNSVFFRRKKNISIINANS